MNRFFEEIKKIIKMDSVSFNGNEEVANYVCALIQDRGLKSIVQHVLHPEEYLSKRQFNVIGIFGDALVDRKIKKGLLLSAHLDTSSPGIYDYWTKTGIDPFDARLVDGHIFGLGAAHAKIDFLCKLRAIERFREKKLKQPIYLVGTCGSQEGMFGVRYLLQSFTLNPAAVLVGEPTGLSVLNQFKSLDVFKVRMDFQIIEKDPRGFNRQIDLHIFGKSCHSAYPEYGKNAIRGALNFLAEAMQQGFEMRFTKLQSGQTLNQVPDHAKLNFFLNAHQFEDFKNFFRDTVQHSSHDAMQYRMEFAQSVETGARFLSEEVFFCILEVLHVFDTMEEQLKRITNPIFVPNHSTLNLAKLNQGPGVLEMLFNAHFIPDTNSTDVHQQLIQEVKALSLRYPNINFSVTRKEICPALAFTDNQDFIQKCTHALEAIQHPFTLCSKSSANEASLYHLAGYPVVAFGPGSSEKNIACSNESNVLEECEKATDFYEKMIQSICH